ncbi:MAG TPA: Y-family DNA polymerase [Victivallales bacterium]|nr:Y-family DNA polymerase [Victivallales bacterium]
MNKYFALVDCDSFYASCERIFEPALKDKPVIVLSNNDGCAIAMSKEAKNLGIKMGTPFYQLKDIIKKHNISLFSSNYELYGDISSRIMNILHNYSANVEIYSIDEAFLKLQDNIESLNHTCMDIVNVSNKWVSMPVKIGVAKTKTLAKVAAELVKINNIKSKYRILVDQNEINNVLYSFPVKEVWGIGYATTKKLNRIGITKASQLLKLSDDYIRKNFSINLLRTIWELKEKPVIELESMPQSKKNLCYSRSFSHTISKYNELKESIVSYAVSASAKIRKDKLIAQSISIYIRTNFFNKKSPKYINSITLPLPYADNATGLIVKYAVRALREIYREGYHYKKSGIFLNDLINENIRQPDMFNEENPNDSKISKVMDDINRKYGKKSIVIASSGLNNQRWQLSRNHISKRYTTRWKDLCNIY